MGIGRFRDRNAAHDCCAEPVFVMAGNPNVGKSSLFNALRARARSARHCIFCYPAVCMARWWSAMRRTLSGICRLLFSWRLSFRRTVS